MEGGKGHKKKSRVRIELCLILFLEMVVLCNAVVVWGFAPM